jgi:hypothetical protein
MTPCNMRNHCIPWRDCLRDDAGCVRGCAGGDARCAGWCAGERSPRNLAVNSKAVASKETPETTNMVDYLNVKQAT